MSRAWRPECRERTDARAAARRGREVRGRRVHGLLRTDPDLCRDHRPQDRSGRTRARDRKGASEAGAAVTSGPTDTGLRLFVVGLSYRTARVEQREKAALTEPAARALVRALASDPWVEEAAALSTCNRTELYVVAGDCAAAESAARLLSAH